MIHKLYYRTFPFKIVIRGFWVIPTQLSVLKDKDLVDKHAWLHLFIRTCSDIRVRKEGNSISIFFKDPNIFDIMSKQMTGFRHTTLEMFRPDDHTVDALLSNRRLEVAEKLPNDCRFRVVLKHLSKKDNFDSFISILERNKDKIFIPNSLRKYMENKTTYWYGNTPYFYVKEEKLLTLIQLSISNKIKEVFSIITTEEAKEKANAE